MNIDYKKEVDSGYDRKVLIEKTIEELLREGIPVEVITDNPNFNFKHMEMLRNLTKGFYSKEDELKERIEGQPFRQNSELSESYSEVVHTIDELYPMTKEEEIEIFTKRDELNRQIEELRKDEALSQKKNASKLIDAITKLKTENPVIDKVIEFQSEMAEISKTKTLSFDDIEKLFRKYGFDKSKYADYQKLYLRYDKLANDLFEIQKNISTDKLELITNKEIEKLIAKRNEIEDEIVSRNIKLVNKFIRSTYRTLLVEQEELYCTCVEGLAMAIKKFDVKQGYKFSSFAYKCMDTQVKHCFKELTGQYWDIYWKNAKIKKTKKIVGKLIGRAPTVDELVDMGFLDMTDEAAKIYEGVPEIMLSSFLNGNRTSLNSFDDEIDMDNALNYYDEREINELEEEVFSGALKEELEEVLDTLTPREKEILVIRFGLRDGCTKTLEEVGKQFGITRERVRQIEAKGLRKLRRSERAEKLRGFLN